VTDHLAIIGQPATLVFRTIHIDRAGRTGTTKVVSGEILGLTNSGESLLICSSGIHLQHPQSHLFSLEGRAGLVGGREIIRDLHDATNPISSRWLSGQELQTELSQN